MGVEREQKRVNGKDMIKKTHYTENIMMKWLYN